VIRRPLIAGCLALAAACGGGAAIPEGGAPGPRTPAVTAIPVVRYRAGDTWRALYTRADTLITTLPNGGQQRQAVERRLHFRWSVSGTGPGFALAVTIDSIRIVGLPGGVGRAMEDSSRGAVIRGVLGADGRIDSLKADHDVAGTHALIADLPWLIPSLGLAGGADALWTDTLNATVRFGVVDLAERTVRESSATPLADAVQVTMSGRVARDGVSPQLHLIGSGARLGTAIVELNGRIRSAVGRDSVMMSASVTSMGQSVQILQVGGYTLTAFP
jgi:hypothetical protein